MCINEIYSRAESKYLYHSTVSKEKTIQKFKPLASLAVYINLNSL